MYESHSGTPNLNEQYFELGRLLGKNLLYLEPPTFAQCLAIALPEHQHPGGHKHTGDLVQLLHLIKSLNSESSCINKFKSSWATCTNPSKNGSGFLFAVSRSPDGAGRYLLTCEI